MDAQHSAHQLHGYVMPTEEQLSAAIHFVDRFARVWNKPDADSLRSLMHSDTQNLIPPMRVPADREGVVEHFRVLLQRLPDLRLEIVRWAPTADSVMIEWQAMATLGLRSLRWRGVDRFRLRGDRTVEAQVYWDTRRLEEQMSEAMRS